ncbi:putative nuclease HARBI1 [Bactrocera neohumeralis]|uniref:putative nuclease HARBI1 n=2 Tax=Bactrocera neohumeralis TaxID=98809 RepID=UPI0021664F38|nr:putative nuclease HARBI1 [Bactrocera neohumeralis]
MEFSDSDDDYEELLKVVIFRRKKEIRERFNFFRLYDEKDFRERFRLCKDAAWEVLQLIRPDIQHATTWNNALSPDHMLTITLRFYATGSIQQLIGDVSGVSTSTVSRVVTLVSDKIARLRERFIRFPTTTEDIHQKQKEFFRIAKFPRVIGALDCTHVKIQSPGGDHAELFRNRKNIFSFNVQTICDARLLILDIVARWPGSTHDATILRNSRIYARLENGEFGDGLVLADKGYENNKRILTPLHSVNNAAERLYNESHIRSRNPIERSYGVWKRRFPVLSLGIRMNCTKVQSIIVATAVLQNICCLHRDTEAPPLDPEIDRRILSVLSIPNNRSSDRRTEKNVTRNNLINGYFATL